MSYRTELIPPACDEIRALPGHVRAQVLELIGALGLEPRPPRAKSLRLPPSGATLSDEPDVYRIWLAGRWRVAYEIDDDARCILVLCLRRKESIDFDTVPSWMHESGTDFPPVETGVKPNPVASDRDRGRGR